jgi:hypothetical protein
MKHTQSIVSLIVALCVVSSPLWLPSRCMAQHTGEGGVELSFVVTNNHGQSTALTLGIDKQATAGLDAEFGEKDLPPLPPSEIFDARFTNPSGTQVLGEGTRIDIRPWRTGVTTWTDSHPVSYQAGRLATNAVIRAQAAYPAVIRGIAIDGRPLKAGDSLATPFASGIVTMQISYDVTPRTLQISPSELTFVISNTTTTLPPAQTVQVQAPDTTSTWQVSSDAPWISFDRSTGRGSGALSLGLRWLAFPEGRSSAKLRVSFNPQTDTTGVIVNVDRLTAVDAPPSASAAAIIDAFPQPARRDNGLGSVSITMRLASPGRTTMRVYDAFGRIVRELRDAVPMDAGVHAVAWDLRDGADRAAPPGVYLCVMEAGGYRSVRRLVVE